MLLRQSSIMMSLTYFKSCYFCYFCRLLSPLALRHFLQWLQTDSAAPGSTPVWLGWCWAIAVASGGVGMTLVHHQFL
jgi:hypothetical protein